MVVKRFICPRCGERAITITKKKNVATVKCNSCTLEKKMENISRIYERVDIFGDFIDIYSNKKIVIVLKDLQEDKDIDKRIKREKKLTDVFSDPGFLEF